MRSDFRLTLQVNSVKSIYKKIIARVFKTRTDFGEVEVSQKGHPVIKIRTCICWRICCPSWVTNCSERSALQSRQQGLQDCVSQGPECWVESGNDGRERRYKRQRDEKLSSEGRQVCTDEISLTAAHGEDLRAERFIRGPGLCQTCEVSLSS